MARPSPRILARLPMLVRAWLMLPAWLLAVLSGLVMLLLATGRVGPGWLDDAGALTIGTAYAAGLAARTGARPLLWGGIALLLGIFAVVAEAPFLRSGAAVLLCSVSAILAVMLTAPAVRFGRAAAESLLAVLIAGIGALATAGLSPLISVKRFEYAALAIALLATFVVVHRLGAGLHGLGRRGVITVLVGALVLGATLAYGELLRRYGSVQMIADLRAGVGWAREHLGASPRPIVALLGVPALFWGVYMRARRRQGWWVCAFGVAATVPVAAALVDPAVPVLGALLGIGYGVVLGLLIGYGVVRLDLVLTGSRGRRGRRSEQASAVRPEPGRSAPLL